MFPKKMSQFTWIAILTMTLSASSMKLASADNGDSDAGTPTVAPAAADDDGSSGDEGSRPSSGGSSRSSSSSSSSRSSSSSYSSPSRPSTPSYSPPARQSAPASAPIQKSKPVDVGNGYTARTNPNGGIQYRDEKTGKDVSRKQFEAQSGTTARPSADGKGIQFKDNQTGRDVSQRQVRADNNYNRPYVAPKNNPSGHSDRGAGYRQNTVHIDNSVHISNTYRSGYGYGYYDPSGSWYNYHYLSRPGYGYGYYDTYGLWNAVTDAIIINQMAQVLANPQPQVVYVQTGDGVNYVQQGSVVIDEPITETKTVTTTTTTTPEDNAGNGTTTTTVVQKTTKTSSTW